MATASDDFNRANENPLAGNWTTRGNALKLVSNAVTSVDLTSDAAAIWNANTFGNDQYSEANVSDTGGISAFDTGAGVSVRVNASGSYTGYRFVIMHSNYFLSKDVAGAYTQIATGSVTWTDGALVRLEATGTGLTGLVAGATITTQTDASIASGSPGLLYSSELTTATWDNWAGGDLGGAVAEIPVLVMAPPIPT